MEEKIIEEARKKVSAKKGFFVHLFFYLIGAIIFISVNMVGDSSDIWFHKPLLAWGISVVIHFFMAFEVSFKNVGKQWEDEQLEKEIRKLKSEEDQLTLKQLQKTKSQNWDDQELV